MDPTDTIAYPYIVHCLQMFEDIENVLQSGCALSTHQAVDPQHPFLASTTPVYDDGISIDEACFVSCDTRSEGGLKKLCGTKTSASVVKLFHFFWP
jgi:hypothetical protein